MEYLHSDSVRLSEDGKSVVIIDQTLLPERTEYLSLSAPDELFEAIKLLKVRGAPAIGIFAGYSMYVLSLGIETENVSTFLVRLKEYAAFLDSSRPTAVNLSMATKRIVGTAEEYKALSVAEIKDKIKNLIIMGVLKENEKIPSVRELATSLTINPNTIIF